MHSTVYLAIAIITAGFFGGAINALLTDGEFKRGYTESGSGRHKGPKIRRPGWLGNALIGSTAGFGMWALYGIAQPDNIQEGIRQIAGSLFAGAAGGRIITAEADKRVLIATKNQLTESLRKGKGVQKRRR